MKNTTIALFAGVMLLSANAFACPCQGGGDKETKEEPKQTAVEVQNDCGGQCGPAKDKKDDDDTVSA